MQTPQVLEKATEFLWEFVLLRLWVFAFLFCLRGVVEHLRYDPQAMLLECQYSGDSILASSNYIRLSRNSALGFSPAPVLGGACTGS